MRVLLTTYGSRGDVEPLVGLAMQVRALGAEVQVCAPPDQEFAELLAGVGVPLVPAFSSVRQWVPEMATRSAADLPRRAAEMMAAQFDAITATGEECDAPVATGVMPTGVWR
jgi:vancomycin aglycone glucosyltransferase